MAQYIYDGFVVRSYTFLSSCPPRIYQLVHIMLTHCWRASCSTDDMAFQRFLTNSSLFLSCYSLESHSLLFYSFLWAFSSVMSYSVAFFKCTIRNDLGRSVKHRALQTDINDLLYSKKNRSGRVQIAATTISAGVTNLIECQYHFHGVSNNVDLELNLSS